MKTSAQTTTTPAAAMNAAKYKVEIRTKTDGTLGRAIYGVIYANNRADATAQLRLPSGYELTKLEEIPRVQACFYDAEFSQFIRAMTNLEKAIEIAKKGSIGMELPVNVYQTGPDAYVASVCEVEGGVFFVSYFDGQKYCVGQPVHEMARNS